MIMLNRDGTMIEEPWSLARIKRRVMTVRGRRRTVRQRSEPTSDHDPTRACFPRPYF